jgi:hypothetical protein
MRREVEALREGLTAFVRANPGLDTAALTAALDRITPAPGVAPQNTTSATAGPPQPRVRQHAR